MTTRAAHAETGTTRTLADYQPQHDRDCDIRLCRHCDDFQAEYHHWSPPMMAPNEWERHTFEAKDCSCGLDALIAAVRHEAGADRLHPHEDGADTDHARLAPASAVAPEKLTHAPTTEAGSDCEEVRFVLHNLDSALKELSAAIRRQCDERRPAIRMTIPVDRARDTDAVIGGALRDARRLITSLVGYRGNPPLSEAGRSAQSASAIQHLQIAPPEDEQTDQARSGQPQPGSCDADPRGDHRGGS